MADLSSFMDFLEDDGFDTPPMPSRAHPEGHVYRVPSPDAETGLRLSALADLTLKQSKGLEISENDVRRLRLNDQEEREFMAQLLTPELVAQMSDDGVKWEHMKRLSMYAFTYFAVSKDAADNAAANGLFSGKAPALNRAQTRAKARSTRSGSAASKRTTPRS